VNSLIFKLLQFPWASRAGNNPDGEAGVPGRPIISSFLSLPSSPRGRRRAFGRSISHPPIARFDHCIHLCDPVIVRLVIFSRIFRSESARTAVAGHVTSPER
jgi:hypothetical protein